MTRPLAGIQRVITKPTSMARFALAILATSNIVWAVAMVMLNDVVYHYAWPVWFGFAGIACSFAVVRLTQHTASVAGAATVTAATGRCVAMILTWVSGRLPGQSAAGLVVVIACWATIAALTGLLFFRGVLRVTARKD